MTFLAFSPSLLINFLGLELDLVLTFSSLRPGGLTTSFAVFLPCEGLYFRASSCPVSARRGSVIPVLSPGPSSVNWHTSADTLG